MPYPAINYTWKYKFLILTVILLVVCFLQAAIIKKERLAHKNEILEIESRNMEQKNKLIEKARALEIKINKQLAENSVIKREKDEKVSELNDTINVNSDRLQQLVQQAIKTDERQCTNTTSTKTVEKVIEVPTTRRGGDLTAEMAKDFQRLSIECSSNYEKLKNEAVELEGWSETIVENSNLK